MTTPFFPFPGRRPRPVFLRARAAAVALCVAFVAACGGGADAPPPAEGTAPPAAVAPVITQQPADLTVANGQPASFTVTATGTAPLAYQWQRNGADIAGATEATYAIANTAPTDTGAVFRAVVSNVAGTATSNTATLTVTTAPPVLTITQQPANTTVTAGASATFTVAATCSSGTLNTQWQRNSGSGGAFVAIASATGASYVVGTAAADNGAQFRAALDCSGQSGATSSTATLSVTSAGATRLDPLTIVGLRDQATTGSIRGMALEPSGSLAFVTNNRIKRLSADLLTITKVAGGDGPVADADGPAATATFGTPGGIASDASGNLYVTDGSRIRRIGIDGNVTTVAGSLTSGYADGTGSAALFNNLRGIAVGPDGDLYVADINNNNIRRVTTAGVATTYAGNTAGFGGAGFADNASALGARFNQPLGLAIAANGDVFVGDNANHRIRRIARSGAGAGAVTTLAGSGTTDPASPDGVGTAAVIEKPGQLALRGSTLTVVQDVGLVRQVDIGTAAVTTLAGTYRSSGSGYADGPRGTALFDVSFGIGSIAALADGRFVFGDRLSVHVIDAAGTSKTIAVNSYSGTGYTDEGGTLQQRPFVFTSNGIQTLTVDAGGNTVVALSGDVRRISPSGTVTVVAGLPGGMQQMLDGNGTNAQFSSIGSGIAAAPDNTLYLSDAQSIRKIDPAGNTTLLAGYRIQQNDFSGNPSFGAVDGPAATARFQNRLPMAVGPDGALYVADSANFAIRRIDAAGNTSTYAGALGLRGIADGTRATARFNGPGSIAFAPDGTLYVGDGGSLRRISADGSSVTSISAPVQNVAALAIDASGNIFIGSNNGLYTIAAGTTTGIQLIPGGQNDAVVYGNAPHLGAISAIAVAGPKQIVMISGGQLVKATLP